MDGDDGHRIGLYYYPIMIINHTYIATTVLYDTCTYILAAAVISHSRDCKFKNKREEECMHVCVLPERIHISQKNE